MHLTPLRARCFTSGGAAATLGFETAPPAMEVPVAGRYKLV